MSEDAEKVTAEILLETLKVLIEIRDLLKEQVALMPKPLTAEQIEQARQRSSRFS